DPQRPDSAADEDQIRKDPEHHAERDQRLDDRGDDGGSTGLRGGYRVPQQNPLMHDRGVDVRRTTEFVAEGLAVDKTGQPFENGINGPDDAEGDAHHRSDMQPTE